ncbi:hypothetical protein EVJ58_g10436, partial [Rhodofomes roseus]
EARVPERLSREDRKVQFTGSSGGFGENALSSSQVAEQTAQNNGRRSFEQSEHSDTYRSSINEVPPAPPAHEPPPHIPSPPPAPQSESSVDDRSLDAKAAREVSREIDALMSSPALTSPISEPSQRTPSPLAPPQAPFARRTVSPRPPMDASVPPPGSPWVNTGGAQFSGYMPSIALAVYIPKYQHVVQDDAAVGVRIAAVLTAPHPQCSRLIVLLATLGVRVRQDLCGRIQTTGTQP